jgi:hypothetical protein
MTLQHVHAVFILKQVVIGEGLSRLNVLLGSPPLSLFDVFLVIGKGLGT